MMEQYKLFLYLNNPVTSGVLKTCIKEKIELMNCHIVASKLGYEVEI